MTGRTARRLLGAAIAGGGSALSLLLIGDSPVVVAIGTGVVAAGLLSLVSTR